MEVLRRLSLSGPYQVHVAPVVLVPDERAHQVFEGFGEQLSSVASGLLTRYPAFTPATILRGNSRSNVTLEEIQKGSWQPDDVLILPAMRSDHAGGIYGLVWVVDRLLGPGGCPWDQEQTHNSLKRHLIEEAYELAEAIECEDNEKMVEELGDVLLQPIMHSQMEKLAGNWDIELVAKGITDKLIRRHPHVFGDKVVSDSDEVLQNWDAIKKAEGMEPKSILGGVPSSLPALLRAHEISKRAARQGFEWEDIDGVWAKFDEEVVELKEAIRDQKGIEDELGDLLFTLVNIARWLKIEPEEALRKMVNRFSARFEAMEKSATKPLSSLTPVEWDDLWNRAKQVVD